MAARIVIVTSGAATTFASTANSTPIFLSATTATAFTSTANQAPLFLTSNVAVAFTATCSNSPLFLTSSQSVAFVVTPNTSTTKLLQPKIGDLTFDSNQTYVTVPDATGLYNSQTNPGGYKPNGDPYEDGRPARDEVNLWTVYRLWSNPDTNKYGSNTQTPDEQNQQNDPDYLYTLTFPTETVDDQVVTMRGIYEIILIAAPLIESYSNYLGDVQLAQKAQQFPDWYTTGVGVVNDPDLINCLNRKRYEFLQEVMCGKCDEGYLYFYGLFVGMLNAMDIQDWTSATDFYNKLKEICAQEISSCGC